MLYFKSCLRCKDGTVELGSDNFGSFLSCLTCGYTINSRSIRANGSIEEPMTLDDDLAMAAAPGKTPVATAYDFAADSDEFEDEPDMGLYEDELEELVIEEEAAAI
ncbi:MAG: hypothetical protein MK134_07250 [Dehalococcoidia bacterium]|jgi:hypothetical protein|nr:hypothetical protein [Dehalococcoidia bacterium]|tara:strand:- start:1633 stop:1950 length:318 start_codon:yes stop_codon:yes gene_type:complete